MRDLFSERVGNVELEVAAECDVQYLHPAADTEDRQPLASEDPLRRPQLERVADPVHHVH